MTSLKRTPLYLRKLIENRKTKLSTPLGGCLILHFLYPVHIPYLFWKTSSDIVSETKQPAALGSEQGNIPVNFFYVISPVTGTPWMRCRVCVKYMPTAPILSNKRYIQWKKLDYLSISRSNETTNVPPKKTKTVLNFQRLTFQYT